MEQQQLNYEAIIIDLGQTIGNSSINEAVLRSQLKALEEENQKLRERIMELNKPSELIEEVTK